MRDVIVWVVGVVVLTLAAVPAQAELVTINIEGIVDTVDDSGNYLEGQVNPGDIITGWYTYDTDTPDSDPLDPILGNYWHYAPPAGISLSIGTLHFKTDFNNVEFHMAIRNDIIPSGEDIYSVVSNNNFALPSGASLDGISWQLSDDQGTALVSDLITDNPPDLLDWEFNHLRIHGERGEYMIHGHILSAVPEPCTLLFLGLGVLSVVRRVR